MSLFGEGFLSMTFEDSDGFKRTIRHELNIGDGIDRAAEMADGIAKADDLVAAYKSAVDALLVAAKFEWVDEGASPWVESDVGGGGTVAREARVSLYLDSPEPQSDKYWSLAIPSPIAGITTGLVVDVSDATLQALVDAIDADAFVSDRETIDTALGINGMDASSGRLITRARKPR